MTEERLVARMVREGFSEEVIFAQRPKGSERASHMTTWGERISRRGNTSIA